MSANLELAMILRWRGQETRAGLTQLNDDLRRTGEVGRGTTDRLIDGTRRLAQTNSALGRQQAQTAETSQAANERLIVGTQRLEEAGRALQRQNTQTGDAGRTTTDRLIDRTRDLERGTTVLGRAYDGLLRRIWDIGRQRPGDQLAESMRRARTEAERTAGSFERVRAAGRLAGGALAGAAAAKFVVSAPINQTMDYGMRLAGMANTAFSDRDVTGRIDGKKELNTAIEKSVRYGGGTRDQAASTLDTLIAAGTMSVTDAMSMLPSLTKAGTASGADPNELANIALRSMATFKIEAKDIPKVMDMAITAGQAGGFELKDMAKWLPQQMAAGRMSGLSGMDGLAKILAANQASVITAGSKDEAGNNLVNFLAKINSQDTAVDAKKLGIDLPGTLAAARAKGIDSMDAFVQLTDVTVGKDKKYQDLRKSAGSAKGADARANLEAQADIIEGSAIGKLIQDRQALLYLVAALNNRDYIKNVESKVKQADKTTDKNFAVISNEAGYKKQQAVQEGEIATYTGFSKLDGPIKSVLDHLTATAREYPNLTAGMKVATTALMALAAAAGASSLVSILTRGGGGAAAAGAGAAAPGILARMTAAGGGALRSLLTTGAFAASMPAASFAAAAPAAAAGGVVAAGAVGYGIGTLISKAIEGTAFSDAIGRSIAIAMAAMGSKDAREALDSERRNAPVEVHVKVSSDSAHLAAEVTSAQQRQALRK